MIVVMESPEDRDRRANERDHAAAKRDIDAAVRDRIAGPGPEGDDRHHSASDRLASMQDRLDAADDRAAAADEHAAKVRKDLEGDELAPLRDEHDRASASERASELGEDRQVGVQPDPLQATDAEGQ